MLLSVGFALTTTLLIVYPKISRVKSGEKVVISNILGARVSKELPSLQTSSDHDNRPSEAPVVAEDRVPLRESDPLPSFMEKDIMELESVCHRVTQKW
jgi:hypothetical protein